MERILRTKSLRTAATLLCVLASAAFAVGWVRSANYVDTIYYVPTHMSTVYRVDAYDGVVHLSRAEVGPFFGAGLVVGGQPLGDNDSDRNHEFAGPTFFGFQCVGPFSNLNVSAPYWFYVLAPLAAGALLNLRTVTRFNLRHLLAAIAIVAVVLTVGRWLSGAGSEWQYLIW
jgi:hypothetical protein